MSEQTPSCGQCHWWRNGVVANYGTIGDCHHPVAASSLGSEEMYDHEGEDCPTYRQRGERLPQRFRYRYPGGEWEFGVCLRGPTLWRAVAAAGGFTSFADDEDATAVVLRMLGGNGVEFVWIDRDFWGGA